LSVVNRLRLAAVLINKNRLISQQAEKGKTMQLLRRLFVSLMTAALSISCATLIAQPVIHHPSSLQSLESKWRWALKEVSDQKLQKSVWIGYAIQRWMGRHSTIGSFDAVSGRTGFSLHERIYGQREEGAMRMVRNPFDTRRNERWKEQTMSGQKRRFQRASRSSLDLILLPEISHNHKK